jgi:hypothetical protein
VVTIPAYQYELQEGSEDAAEDAASKGNSKTADA